MANLTIHNLDDGIKNRLRIAAAVHGRTMEEEARSILQSALTCDVEEKGLGTQIHRMFAGLDLPELEIAARTELARSVDFET